MRIVEACYVWPMLKLELVHVLFQKVESPSGDMPSKTCACTCFLSSKKSLSNLSSSGKGFPARARSRVLPRWSPLRDGIDLLVSCQAQKILEEALRVLHFLFETENWCLRRLACVFFSSSNVRRVVCRSRKAAIRWLSVRFLSCTS